jgi:hypothetical protein
MSVSLLIFKAIIRLAMFITSQEKEFASLFFTIFNTTCLHACQQKGSCRPLFSVYVSLLFLTFTIFSILKLMQGNVSREGEVIREMERGSMSL